MKKLSALIALSLFAASSAYAQDGGSCGGAIPLSAPAPGTIVNVDTSTGTGWINNYGPLVSPSNDIVYTFTTGAAAATGSITPTASSYAFAIYVLGSCTPGAGPTPIGATSTLNTAIALSGITAANTQYWVAVTGTAAGGAGANGTVTLSVDPTLPVTLQGFQID
ncbi:MAG: hypothetical protein ABI843_11135 [Dokdonella sp.]